MEKWPYTWRERGTINFSVRLSETLAEEEDAELKKEFVNGSLSELRSAASGFF